MPKRTNNYTADDGFVEDAPASPPSKRNKATPKTASTSTTANARKAKEGKEPVATEAQTDDNGDEYWELSSGGTRRITVNVFKGTVMVNLREYYEAGGKQLPGKKGISLPVDQFAALVQVLPQIEQALTGKGEEIPRPVYEGSASGVAAEKDDGKDEREAEEGGKKKNFEATSDADG